MATLAPNQGNGNQAPLGNAAAYTRVSTQQQSFNGYSLAEQISRITNYCSTNLINLITMIQESISGTKNVQMLNIINHPDIQHLIVCDATRFSRNINKGIDHVEKLLQNGKTVHFIEENLVINKENYSNSKSLLMEKFKFAEDEYNKECSRIKNIKTFLLDNCQHQGGILPYGLEFEPTSINYYDPYKNKYMSKLVNKYKINEYEIEVIKFIDICKKTYYTSDDLNNQLINILGYYPKDPIVLFNSNERENLIHVNDEPLNANEIIRLLNDYYIYHRNGKSFTYQQIRNIISEEYIKLHVFPGNANVIRCIRQEHLMSRKKHNLMNMDELMDIDIDMNMNMNMDMDMNMDMNMNIEYMDSDIESISNDIVQINKKTVSKINDSKIDTSILRRSSRIKSMKSGSSNKTTIINSCIVPIKKRKYNRKVLKQPQEQKSDESYTSRGFKGFYDLVQSFINLKLK